MSVNGVALDSTTLNALALQQLGEIIRAWPRLSGEIRVSMLMLARSAAALRALSSSQQHAPLTTDEQSVARQGVECELGSGEGGRTPERVRSYQPPATGRVELNSPAGGTPAGGAQ